MTRKKPGVEGKRAAKGQETGWLASQIEFRATDDLIPYARNARLHSAEQVSQIAGSIRTFGFTVPVLIERDGGIIAGHGRVLAAQEIGMPEVPCIVVPDDWDETKRRAYVLADNRLAESSEWDEELLRIELGALLDVGVDGAVLGFGEEEMRTILKGWDADLKKTEKVKPELSGMTATIKVKVDQTAKDEAIAAIREALEAAGIEGAEIG